MLEVPTVLGLMELFEEVAGIRLKAPKDPAQRKLWIKDLVARIGDLQPALESFDSRFVFMRVKPGTRRDELAREWPRVEEYRRRRSQQAQGDNVYSRWLLDRWSEYMKKKLTLVEIETQFQADFPEAGYCETCRSNVWTATRSDPCPACRLPVTRRGGPPDHPGHKAIRERLRRAGRLG